MRRQLIEALSYPKLLVQKQIEERNCPHAHTTVCSMQQMSDVTTATSAANAIGSLA